MADGMTVTQLKNQKVRNRGSLLLTLQEQFLLGVTADDAAAESWEATMAYDLGGGATFNLRY